MVVVAVMWRRCRRSKVVLNRRGCDVEDPEIFTTVVTNLYRCDTMLVSNPFSAGTLKEV